MKLFDFLKKPSTMIFLGIAGIVTTNILTARATIKYVEKRAELDHEPTKEEAIKIAASCYGPVVAAGIVTAGAILKGNSTYQSIQHNLIDSSNMLMSKYKNYYDTTKKTLGIDVANDIQKEIVRPKLETIKKEPVSQGSIVILDPFSPDNEPRFIETTMEEFLDARYYFNKHLIANNDISINYWYDDIDADSTKYGETLGYNMHYLYDNLGEDAWVHIELSDEPIIEGNFQYYLVRFSIPPIAGYENY